MVLANAILPGASNCCIQSILFSVKKTALEIELQSYDFLSNSHPTIGLFLTKFFKK